MVRSAQHGASNIMEPEHVDQAPSHDFPLAAVRGDLRNGPSGLDDHRQELLAERGQAERADRNWLASRSELCIRVRSNGAISTARDECKQQPIDLALSRRPKESLISAQGVADQ
jgi:hypothetical protein